MKTKLFVAIVAAAVLTFGVRGIAADKAAAPGDAKAELQDLIKKVQTKLSDGKKTEKDLADDLKEFDALLAKHKGEKTDDVAGILLMKAMLYIQIFDDTDKGVALIKQLKRDFPNTAPGKDADQILASIEKQEEGKKIQRALVVGSRFPDFDEKDHIGKPLSIAKYKGKVVLVDFWATWCGPCVRELPNVLKAYEKHHPKGFEIVGISLDNKEEALTGFIKKNNMTWQHFFDGKGWQNKLATKYGVTSIPATYLLDGEGKIVAKDLRGDALDEAVGKLLAKR